MISVVQYRARIGSFACSWSSIAGKIWARKHGGSRHSPAAGPDASSDPTPGGCSSRILLLVVLAVLLSHTTVMIIVGQMCGPVAGGDITGCSLQLVGNDVIVTVTIVFVVSIYIGNKAAHTYFGNIAGVYGPPVPETPQENKETVQAAGHDQLDIQVDKPQAGMNTNLRQERGYDKLERNTPTEESTAAAATASHKAGQQDVRPKTSDQCRKLPPRQATAEEFPIKKVEINAACGANETVEHLDWPLYEMVIRSQYGRLALELGVHEFMDEVLSEGLIDQDLHTAVKMTRKPADKLNTLIDHIFQAKDGPLLLYLIEHKDLEDIDFQKLIHTNQNVYQHSQNC